MPEMNCKAIKVPSHSVSMTSVSVLRYSFHRVCTQLCVCGSSSGCLRPCEDAAMPTYVASPLLMPPLATLCPLNALGLCLSLCSILRHMVILLSIHSQRLISASLEVRTCHLSKKKKKADHCCAATYFFFCFFCKNWRNTLINNSNIKKISHITNQSFFSS